MIDLALGRYEALLPDLGDVEAALRLGVGAPVTDPRRGYALAVVRACSVEPPEELFASARLPAAWHLVATALEVAAGDVIVERSSHNDGAHQDIVVRYPDERPTMWFTWTSGTISTDGPRRPLEGSYVARCLRGRAALERAVRAQFAGLEPQVNPGRVATAKFLACATDYPACLQPDVDQDGSELNVWTLARPGGEPCPKVGLAAGTVESAGEVVDASELLADMDCAGDRGLGR